MRGAGYRLQAAGFSFGAIAIAGLFLLGSSAGASSFGARVETMVQLGMLSAELREFQAATGSLPATADGIAGIASDPRLLADVWGNDVRYIRVAGGFWLMSWGADGAPGGEGDSADVVHIAR